MQKEQTYISMTTFYKTAMVRPAWDSAHEHSGAMTMNGSRLQKFTSNKFFLVFEVSRLLPFKQPR